MPAKYYLTTPIYYVNARPHIGHAYTTIVADVLSRRQRLLGDDVFFLTGTDEHGQKIERSAAAAGIAPQAFADEVSATFRTLWERMGITNDAYIRTTDEAHKRGVQKLFTTLYENEKIYLSSYTGQYSIGEEMFVEGPPGTIGPDGKPTETVTEENFFFRLSEYQLELLNLIESNTLAITPESRKNEVLSFLRGNVSESKGGVSEEGRPLPTQAPQDPGAPGLDSETWVPTLARTAAGIPYLPGALKDLSISRSSFTWGIPVPAAIQQAAGAKEPHIIYVWLDALANYITALGYGSDDPSAEANFHKYWPADLHLVGKEIIRFHCVYWPAFLLAAGLPLPKAITAHGWLLFDESKMSKSKGNVVRTETILQAFGALCPPPPADVDSGDFRDSASSDSLSSPLLSSRSGAEGSAVPPVPALPTAHDRDLFAADVLRYYLLREIPFGQDGSFSFEALITRYNADLANGYGNLVSRTLAMIQKYSKGIVEDCVEAHVPFVDDPEHGLLISESQLLSSRVPEIVARVSTGFEQYAFSDALSAVFTYISWLDQFITSRKPWAASETDFSLRGRRSTLYTAAESIRILTALLHPILPYATASVWRQLGLGDITKAGLTDLKWGGLQPGTKLGPLGPIFPRADKGLAQTMIDLEAQSPNPNTPEGANAAADALTPSKTEFPTTLLVSELGAPGLAPETWVSSDPAAGPRTSTLAEPSPGAQVAGSNAATTERELPTAETTPTDASPTITIDDFAKIELRVAEIMVCERIPKADKLLRLEVDLGYERRQILSGIAEWYTPEELIGRRIVVITNLAPRKMRGLESHGMLLAASADGGKPALATFLDSDELPLGSRLK